jgi:hypothetical protein
MGTVNSDTAAYEVIVHREVTPGQTWWVFDIPALGATGQALKLTDVAPEARGIIAAWEEDGPAEEDIEVTVRFDGEAEARRLWDQSEQEERVARLALEEAAEHKRQAVATLREQHHYGATDAANILGVSRQRIYQLSGKK